MVHLPAGGRALVATVVARIVVDKLLVGELEAAFQVDVGKSMPTTALLAAYYIDSVPHKPVEEDYKNWLVVVVVLGKPNQDQDYKNWLVVVVVLGKTKQVVDAQHNLPSESQEPKFVYTVHKGTGFWLR